MKILIADDEKLVRKSLNTLLQRAGVAAGDIYEASNGARMLEMIGQNTIDVAFVDVKMPLQNGLEAIETSISISPDTTFFILSGYSDFSYAQRAISMGVTNYYLKPIDQQAVEQALHSATLLQEKKRILRTLQLERTIKKLLRHEQSVFLQYLMPVVVVDHSGRHSDEYLRELLEKELSPENILVLSADFAPPMVLLFSTSRDTLLGCTSLLERCAADGVYLFCAEPCSSATLLSEMHSCQQLFFSSFLHLPRPVNTTLTMSGDTYPLNHDVYMLFGRLLESFAHQDASLFHSLYPKFMALLRDSWQSIELTGLQQGLQFYFKCDFSGANSFDEFLNVFKTILANRNVTSTKNVVQKVLEDMQLNFSRDLSIQSYADKFGITPNYLSAQFSTQVKVSFIKVLTSIRITHAKQLLSTTSLSITQIAEVCGYYSTSYFIKSFYKLEEMTPAEYRGRQ